MTGILFQELALNPECISDPRFIPFLKWRVGMMNGRFISGFPRDWKNKALQAANKIEDEQIRKSIKETLSKPHIQSCILPTDRRYLVGSDWVESVVNISVNSPFDVVVSKQRLPIENSFSIDELDSYVEKSDNVTGYIDFSNVKNVEVFRRLIAPFLLANKRICLVNKWQWLMTDKRKVLDFFKILMDVWIDAGGVEFVVIRSSNEKKGFDVDRWVEEKRLLDTYLTSKKFKGKFKFIAVNDSSNELHARSFLGTNCGISLDYGFEVGVKRHPWRVMIPAAFNAEYQMFVESDIRDLYPDYLEYVHGK